MKNSVLRTSLRSETQATDSTCKGCSPKSAATKALRQRAPVIRRSAMKSRTVLAACSTRLTTWCQPALLDAEELAVEHVGEHRDRMPVAHGNAGEGVDHALAGQSLADVRVLDDIAGVVQQHEGIGVDRPVDCRHGRHQQETDEQFAPHGKLNLGSDIRSPCTKA